MRSARGSTSQAHGRRAVFAGCSFLAMLIMTFLARDALAYPPVLVPERGAYLGSWVAPRSGETGHAPMRRVEPPFMLAPAIGSTSGPSRPSASPGLPGAIDHPPYAAERAPERRRRAGSPPPAFGKVAPPERPSHRSGCVSARSTASGGKIFRRINRSQREDAKWRFARTPESSMICPSGSSTRTSTTSLDPRPNEPGRALPRHSPTKR
jgi:hypothetical protein